MIAGQPTITCVREQRATVCTVGAGVNFFTLSRVSCQTTNWSRRRRILPFYVLIFIFLCMCRCLSLQAQNRIGGPSPLWQQWRTAQGTWHAAPDRMVGAADGATRGFAIAEDARYGIAQTIEIALTPQKHIDASWSAAGVCLYQDAADYWRLALAESPDSKNRYAELLVLHGDGGAIQKALRTVAEDGKGFSWAWNQTYRLRLTTRADEITGEVLSLQNKSLWRVTYSVAEAHLVPSGRPALNVQGMQATFAEGQQKFAPEISSTAGCSRRPTRARPGWLCPTAG